MASCKVCGAPLQGMRRCYCSAKCASQASLERRRVQIQKPRPLSPVYTERPCMDCGKVVRMHIKSKRCTACQRLANMAADRESKRRQTAGKTRKIGSLDICQRCGKEYTVTAGSQRYCPACAEAAWKENDREKAKAQMRENLKDEAYREQRNAKRRNVELQTAIRTCVICGKEFKPYSGRSMACSPECQKEHRLRHMREYYHQHKEEKR